MVLGIIAEYNPFHNGHLYHLLKSKEEAEADTVVAIVGGNFTQRGEASVIDKWTKAEMCMANGVDLVLELPVLYATSSAENFAEGAVKILNSLKVVNSISFGVETESLNKLNMIANLLYEEPREYKEILEASLKRGISFPKAREEAIIKYSNYGTYKEIISKPNNILAIEYLKAIKKYKSRMKPICIKRKDVGHFDEQYNGEISSATAIRNLITLGKIQDAKKFMTPSSYTILTEELQKGHFVKDIRQFENIMLYNLRNMSIEEIANLPDVSEGLENAIKNAANSCNTIDEFINIVSTKRYAGTRIKRILLYSLLNITKRDIAVSKKITPYVRVLGANDKGKNLISRAVRANPKLKVVTSVKKFVDSNMDRNIRLMLEKDIKATNIYTLGYERDSWSNLDYSKKLIM